MKSTRMRDESVGGHGGWIEMTGNIMHTLDSYFGMGDSL
jgi:hypothetical protein